jgi:ubiquitin-conjugating enzyme E2 variant
LKAEKRRKSFRLLKKICLPGRFAAHQSKYMKILALTLLKIVGTVLAADFVGGFVHWLEDAYIREDTPLIGKWVARPNIVHHHYPRYMARFNWWHTSRDLILVSAALVVLAWCLGVLAWEVWLFAILAANANEFHKWEHRTRKENGRVISFLQDIKLLQTAKHHARHHTDPKNSHYCTTTNILNPVLDKTRFWNGLEWMLARTVGLKRREDTSVRGHGPGPAWLEEYRRQPA